MKPYMILTVCILLSKSFAIERTKELPDPLGVTEMISFEGMQVPNDWHAHQSQLMISDKYFKNGKQSIRWDWSKGASLTLNRKMGYIPQWIARVHYTNDGEKRDKSGEIAFSAWIYNEKPVDDKLTFQFGRDEKEDCSFDFYLNYKGWRHAMVHYGRGYMRGTPHVDMNRLRIKAPDNGTGKLYVDSVMTAFEYAPKGIMPNRQLPHLQMYARRSAESCYRLFEWSKQRPFLPIPEQVTKEQRQSIALMKERYANLILTKTSSPLSDKAFVSLKKQYDDLDLSRNTDGIVTGPPLYTYGYREVHRRVPEEQIGKHHFIRPLSTFMYGLAQAYANAEGESKAELADMVVAMLDYMHDQGYAEGGTLGWQHHWGYETRSIAPTLFLLRDELAKRGILQRSLDDMRWMHGMNVIYDSSQAYGVKSAKGNDADDLNSYWFERLGLLLAMPDMNEQVRDLICFKDYYGNVALGLAPGLGDTFKADGSTYHHAGCSPGYGMGAMTGTAKTVSVLNHTVFAPAGEGYANFKRAMIAMGFYINKKYSGLNTSNITFVYDREYNLPPLLAYLAAQTDINGKRCYDKELAALYLSYGLDDSLSQELRSVGFEPLPTERHKTMTYFALGLHRWKDALLTVKGHSRYVYPRECWGRMGGKGTTMLNVMGFGHMEMIYPENPGETRVNSGIQTAGWDWNKWPGTTTVNMPWDRVEYTVNQVGEEGAAQLFSDQGYCGGVDMDNNGIFAVKFHGHQRLLMDSFYANKSWFFVDDVIVCVGSGIRDTIKDYPTVTTLMQRPMDETSTILVAGKQVVESSDENVMVESPLWLLDNRQTGYLVMPGANLKVRRSVQKTPDQNNTKMLSGEFATAWLDHGFAPTDAAYAYAMVLKTDANRMEAFQKEPPFKVLSQTPSRHIVSFPRKKMIGYALFEAHSHLDQGPLLAIDTPAILLFKNEGNQLRVSGVDPDLRIYDGASDDTNPDGTRRLIDTYQKIWYNMESQPSRVRAIIKGAWTLKSERDTVRTWPYNDDTVVEFTTKDGLSVDFTLVAK